MLKVSPYVSKLDAGNAYWMARLAEAVYSHRSENDLRPDEAAILATLKADDEGFQSVFGADNNSAQAALIEHQDYLCISCRGTDELADWLDNIKAFPSEQLFGKFHRGFWHSVEDIWAPIAERLAAVQAQQQQQKGRKLPVFITGHSLGGAMAVIMAAKFVHADEPFTSVYTFGQPRAMTRETARLFNVECGERVYRFHNNNDMVTRVPARAMGYSHVGCYLYISEEKSIHREPGFWFRFLDAIDGAVAAVKEKGLDGIEDHGMARYLASIKRWNYHD
ncbi:lipase family protein [Neiella marina]|uniref:Lipase family protein n=1 Tax=Neiella holothuriorum TaxID=2870530 RepID=A0ABS7EJX2_9GAMM|nr:lipase family protein [Neiella holothuriorum]MBW8191962.1 lipase family protein [Neiella holothuriorum]